MRLVTLAVSTALLGGLWLALPATSRATDARVEALTINGLYIDDFEGLKLFPTVIARAGNRVVAGLGASGSAIQDNTFGVIAGGKDRSWGTFSLFLRGRSPYLTALGGYDSEVAPGVNVPQQQYDLGWARQFGKLGVGARFEQAHSSTEAGGSTTSPFEAPGSNWNSTAFHAGLKLDTGTSDFLEVGGSIRTNSYRNEVLGLEDDAGSSYRVSARYWRATSDKVSFVPGFDYSHDDLTRMGETDRRHTYNALHAGGAFLIDVNQDNLLTLGLAVNRQEDDFNDVSVTWLPTFFGSLEFDIKSWLTGRLGCQQAMRAEKRGDNLEVNTADFLYGLGVGMHLNNFDIDATLNQNFPFTGGYFISGQQTAGNLFGRVTADYHF